MVYTKEFMCSGCKKSLKVNIDNPKIKNSTLVKLKCPTCGALTEVNPQKDGAITNDFDKTYVPIGEHDKELRAFIVCQNTLGQTQEYEIDNDYMIIGRLVKNASFKADIAIPTDDKYISKKHAILRKKKLAFTIEDADSTNGTFFNNEQIFNGTEIYLTHNDKVRLGQTVFTFIIKNN